MTLTPPLTLFSASAAPELIRVRKRLLCDLSGLWRGSCRQLLGIRGSVGRLPQPTGSPKIPHGRRALYARAGRSSPNDFRAGRSSATLRPYGCGNRPMPPVWDAR